MSWTGFVGPASIGGADGSEHHDLLRIDAQQLPTLGFSEPRELHDGSARGGKDQPLDVLGLPLDSKALATNDRDLCDRTHGEEGNANREYSTSGLPQQIRLFLLVCAMRWS